MSKKKNDSHRLIRRLHVARCMAAAMTVRETRDALAKKGICNPDTGEPWSKTTVDRDIQKLRENWKADAARTIEEHRAEMLHTLREIRRRALIPYGDGDPDLRAALRAVEQEAKLLGLYEATKIRVDGEISVADQRRKADERLEELEGEGLPAVPEAVPVGSGQ